MDLLRYVESLMAAGSDRDFKLESFDGSESAEFAVPLQSSLIRLQTSHLRFLRGIGWHPTLDWTDLYLVTCHMTRHWPSGLQINQHPHKWRSALGDFLDRLEQTGIPIRVQLGPHKTQGLFFPDPKNMQPRSIDVFPNPDILKWLLQDFGHRFDELSILWDPTLAFPEIDLEPNDAYEMRTIVAALLNSHQTSQQCDYEILETLAREAYGASQLFEKIQTWFPKIRRLALYIPAAIYPSTDQAFVDKFLPCNENETWEVQHHGSRGGIERTADSPQEYHMGHPYEMDLTIRRYDSSISPSEVLINAMKYTMIHRVFHKKALLHESGNSKYLKTLNTERNILYPPHPPTVTDLFLDKDHWTEKPWMVLLIKYCRCNGFSSAHVLKGKTDFSLETSTLEELRQVAQAVFEDVLYT
ncbi:MAG: hypothetical protein L6R38_004153 [Xanthoria sp. 2 TBL-2021]|nr:MAG: hypothetical protein L6R38_004153 [Xanthoria sp. 2 TBL-2021]